MQVSPARIDEAVGGCRAPGPPSRRVTRDYFRSLAQATHRPALRPRRSEMTLRAQSQRQPPRAGPPGAGGPDARIVPLPALRASCAPRTSFVIADAGYKENVIPSTAHVPRSTAAASRVGRGHGLSWRRSDPGSPTATSRWPWRHRKEPPRPSTSMSWTSRGPHHRPTSTHRSTTRSRRRRPGPIPRSVRTGSLRGGHQPAAVA